MNFHVKVVVIYQLYVGENSNSNFSIIGYIMLYISIVFSVCKIRES